MEKINTQASLGIVNESVEVGRTLRFEWFEFSKAKWSRRRMEIQKNLPLYLTLFALIFFLMPTVGYCSVESTLSAVQGKLITTILPLAAILGLIFAALSFVMGSPNARSHFVLAIIGAVVGFGAPSIVQFIQGLVH